jgi:hypothetical protein
VDDDYSPVLADKVMDWNIKALAKMLVEFSQTQRHRQGQD